MDINYAKICVNTNKYDVYNVYKIYRLIYNKLFYY